MSRGNPHPHKYKHGKQTEKISFKEFSQRLETTAFADPPRDKSFLVLLCYLGCRIGELLLLEKEHVKRLNGELAFHLEIFKRGERKSPLRLTSDLPYIDLFLQYLRSIRAGKRVFPFSYTTGWRIVKRAFPIKYPHYFRLNRATHFLDDPETTIPQMKAWFGWKRAETITDYIGYSDRYVDKGIERIKKEVEAE